MFLGQLVFGPFPFEALGLGRLAKGAGPGPKVPTIAFNLMLKIKEMSNRIFRNLYL